MKEIIKCCRIWLDNHKAVYALILPWALAIFFIGLAFYILCNTFGLL